MYSAHITRQNKGAVVLLIDQSGSMAEETTFNGSTTTKATAVADIANSLIEEFINRSNRERGVADYFDVAVIGYGGEQAKSLLGNRFRSIVEIDSMYVPTTQQHSFHTLATGEKLDFLFQRRQWVEPVAKGRTPMKAALQMAHRLAAAWCRKHPSSFPPIVINITDGEATDATAEELLCVADRLKSLGTDDGSLLLFNIHVNAKPSQEKAVVKWPADVSTLPDSRNAHTLYTMASPLPPLYNTHIAQIKGEEPSQVYRAVCYNSSCDDLVGAMLIGSLSIGQII